ncbi:MAG: hypothetical protein VX405_05305 [Myxococcota bacterium]|nr:hypothetical protein [Myxococcota bacterium]
MTKAIEWHRGLCSLVRSEPNLLPPPFFNSQTVRSRIGFDLRLAGNPWAR